jgi:hypothetical protein
MRYVFQRGFPAILVEIYLPKKSGFQGVLYKALTAGRNPAAVKKHLKEHTAAIQSMLQTDWPQLEKQVIDDAFIDELAANIKEIYSGYSMYEVDGVFFNAEDEPVEERTQVIRLWFEYRVDEATPDEVIYEIKRFLRSPSSALTGYTPVDERARPELEQVEAWLAQVAVFLIGFLVHGIILEIKENRELTQDEIWMTSFWNGTINRFLPARD